MVGGHIDGGEGVLYPMMPTRRRGAAFGRYIKMRRVKLAASRNPQTGERIDGRANEGKGRLAVGEATAQGRIVTTGPAAAAGYGIPFPTNWRSATWMR